LDKKGEDIVDWQTTITIHQEVAVSSNIYHPKALSQFQTVSQPGLTE